MEILGTEKKLLVRPDTTMHLLIQPMELAAVRRKCCEKETEREKVSAESGHAVTHFVLGAVAVVAAVAAVVCILLLVRGAEEAATLGPCPGTRHLTREVIIILAKLRQRLCRPRCCPVNANTEASSKVFVRLK